MQFHSKLSISRHSLQKAVAFLPACYYLANLFRMTDHSPIPYLAMLFLTGGTGLFKLLIFRRKSRGVLLLYMLVYLLCLLFNCFLIGNVSITDMGSELLLLGITCTMLFFPLYCTQGAIAYYITAAVFVIASVTGVNPTRFLTSSSNYISVLLILSACLYYLGIQNEGKKLRLVDFIPAGVNFYLSIWARGRGGMLSCSFMLLLLLLIYIHRYAQGSKKKWLIAAFCVILAITILAVSNISIIDTFFGYGKFATRGTDNSARALIWSTYFNKTQESALYFVFGAPLKDIPLIHSFNGNTHNSFIQLHANAGLVMFLLFAVMAFKALAYEIKKKNDMMVLIMLTLFVRGMTDKFVFGQYGMPIVVFAVLHPAFDQYIADKTRPGL